MKKTLTILTLLCAAIANGQATVNEVYTDGELQYHVVSDSGLVARFFPTIENQKEVYNKAVEFAKNYVIPEPIVEDAPVSIPTDCIRANDGYTINLKGTYSLEDGECSTATDTNGDTFVISGEYVIDKYTGAKVEGNVIILTEKGWEVNISGDFTLTKQGGAYADFKIKSKQI